MIGNQNNTFKQYSSLLRRVFCGDKLTLTENKKFIELNTPQTKKIEDYGKIRYDVVSGDKNGTYDFEFDKNYNFTPIDFDIVKNEKKREELKKSYFNSVEKVKNGDVLTDLDHYILLSYTDSNLHNKLFEHKQYNKYYGFDIKRKISRYCVGSGVEDYEVIKFKNWEFRKTEYSYSNGLFNRKNVKQINFEAKIVNKKGKIKEDLLPILKFKQLIGDVYCNEEPTEDSPYDQTLKFDSAVEKIINEMSYIYKPSQILKYIYCDFGNKYLGKRYSDVIKDAGYCKFIIDKNLVKNKKLLEIIKKAMNKDMDLSEKEEYAKIERE